MNHPCLRGLILFLHQRIAGGIPSTKKVVLRTKHAPQSFASGAATNENDENECANSIFQRQNVDVINSSLNSRLNQSCSTSSTSFKSLSEIERRRRALDVFQSSLSRPQNPSILRANSSPKRPSTSEVIEALDITQLSNDNCLFMQMGENQVEENVVPPQKSLNCPSSAVSDPLLNYSHSILSTRGDENYLLQQIQELNQKLNDMTERVRKSEITLDRVVDFITKQSTARLSDENLSISQKYPPPPPPPARFSWNGQDSSEHLDDSLLENGDDGASGRGGGEIYPQSTLDDGEEESSRIKAITQLIQRTRLRLAQELETTFS